MWLQLLFFDQSKIQHNSVQYGQCKWGDKHECSLRCQLMLLRVGKQAWVLINVSTTILCFSCSINRSISCSLRASWLKDQDHVLVSFFVSFVVVFFCFKWKLWWFLSFSSFLSSSPWVTNFFFCLGERVKLLAMK